MKKLLGVLLVLVLVVVVVAAVLFTVVLRNINPIVKSVLEKRLPEILGTDVSVEEVDISLRSGVGEIRGLVIGNPDGYESSQAFRLDRIAVTLDVASLRGDTIIIRDIEIEQPEVTFEGGLRGSNLGDILDNISGEEEPPGDGASPADREETPAPGEKESPVIIESLILADGRVHLVTPVTDGEAATISLAKIEMEDLGAREGGVELKKVASFVVGTVLKTVFTSILNSPDLTFEGAEALRALARSGLEDATVLVEDAAMRVLRDAGLDDGAAGEIVGALGGILGEVAGGGTGEVSEAVAERVDEAAAELRERTDEAVARAQREVEATMRDLQDDIDAAADDLETPPDGLLGDIFGATRDSAPAENQEPPAEAGEEPAPATEGNTNAVEDAVGGALRGIFGGGD